MACWVVPSVASEIWHIPVDQVLSAVKSGKIASRQENGFTFVDVAPGAAPEPPVLSVEPLNRRKPVTYKVVRPSVQDTIPLPRTAEVITPAEEAALTGATDEPSVDADRSLSMGDWRRGRRTAAVRRTPPQ